MHSDVILTGHAERLASVDSLLPAPLPFPASDTAISLAGNADDAGAFGQCICLEVERDAPQAPWRALIEYRLDVRLGGKIPGAALDDLLTRWDEHLRKVAEPADAETAAVVPRASRDAEGTVELLKHGFAPVRVIAARPAARMPAASPSITPGVRIRPAGPEDLDTALALQLELQSYEARFGTVTLREGVEEVLAKTLSEHLARPEPTVWIAELYGRALGMVLVQLPEETGWISGRVVGERVGYLQALAVAEAARSSGVGTALAEHAHHVFDQARVDVVLLHHALANPRSTPFWYAQGYRPLWTYWQRRPAVR